ncbi:MAG: N-acetyltransferase family protein [Bacteroidota bacterium]
MPILAAFCVDIQFQPISEQDLHEVKAIYDWYIANSTATFHTEPIRHDQLTTFLYVGDPVYPSYLVRYNGAVAGYCFLTKYKDRPAYRRSAEVTIYLRPEFHGKGIGSAALQRLIQDARANDFKTLLAIITGGNDASIALFVKAGFVKCAHFRKVGEKFNQVLDVVGYQLEL